jgi:uncharacterized protein involved in type VI secretion and phage assembly
MKKEMAFQAGSNDGQYYGVFPALVTDNVDPEQQARVKIKFPWLMDAGGDDEFYEAWARLATLMAGNERGTWFMPEVDDEVLVSFEAGDPRRPYVLGMLWNGQDAPPETMDGSGDNNVKTIRSRNGLRISLDDTAGQESLALETPSGQSLVLKDGPGAIEIIDSNGNSVKLETGGVTVDAAAKVTVNASMVEVSAGMLTVNAGLAKFSGVVQADTVITISVISASYTPGAGNIW